MPAVKSTFSSNFAVYGEFGTEILTGAPFSPAGPGGPWGPLRPVRPMGPPGPAAPLSPGEPCHHRKKTHQSLLHYVVANWRNQHPAEQPQTSVLCLT